MSKTHDLLHELADEPKLQTMRWVPSVTLYQMHFQSLLCQSSNPHRSIATFHARASVTARQSISNFQNSLDGKEGCLDELIDLGNAARCFHLWLIELETCLQYQDRVEMIARAIMPMAWLEALIKTLDLKSLGVQNA